ncbi:MAG: MOSC domain-containing protein [Acidobacteriota bacterium]|jgi:MOSC domain-containing protein YiiM
MSGRLEAIWIKRAKGGPMDFAVEAVLRQNRGLVGNADQGGHRQVTVIEREAMEAAGVELGCTVDPRFRRANLMVSGLRLGDSRGRVLRIGALRLEIRGETRPCERMDQALPGLRRALGSDWRGGVYGVVLEDATIRLEVPVFWE